MENVIAGFDRKFSLEAINSMLQEGLTGLLGVQVTAVHPQGIDARMMVNERTSRPGGYMHGGVNLVLGETLAGLGSLLLIDSSCHDALGVQVSAHHTASIKEGVLLARASLLHRGKRTHIWDITMKDEEGRCVSSVRVTNMIVEKR